MDISQLRLVEANRNMAQCIFVPSLANGNYIVFEKGTGDGLSREDTKDGYVDYINYTTYNLSLDGELELSECDGGMVLLTEYYELLAVEEILEYLLEEISYPDACPDIDKEDIRSIFTRRK